MTINLSGCLTDMSRPCVMGIINATPDSFFAPSRVLEPQHIAQRASAMLAEGASMLDVGACSTRPGSEPVSEDEEMRRLAVALPAIREACPQAVLSVDTFRASVARYAVQQWGVNIVNDIGGGDLDDDMLATVACLGVPYVLMHGGSPATQLPSSLSGEDVVVRVCQQLEERIQRLHDLGVADIIIDPGFGFGKTMSQNYDLLRHLSRMAALFSDYPLLVGLSRKRMAWQLLGITPDEALNATTALNTIALQAGATILRVHDVAPAVQTTRILQALRPI